MEEKKSLKLRFVGHSTQQRRLILQIIERDEKHLDAGEIYTLARLVAPTISLSTVYRTLHYLKKQGLVKEYQFGIDRRCYEITPSSGHHHMICKGCGRVFEFTCSSTEEIKSRLNKEQGFRVLDVDVRFTGLCPECLNNTQIEINNSQFAQAGRR